MNYEGQNSILMDLTPRFSMHFVYFFLHVFNSASGSQIRWVEFAILDARLEELGLEALRLSIFLPIIQLNLLLHLFIFSLVPHQLVSRLHAHVDAADEREVCSGRSPYCSAHIIPIIKIIKLRSIKLLSKC